MSPQVGHTADGRSGAAPAAPARAVAARGEQFLRAYPRGALWWRALSRLVIGATGLVSKAFVQARHRTVVHNAQTLQEVFRQAQQEGRGVVTVMNHVSVLDDPLVWGGTLRAGQLWRPARMRWTLGAKDICFRNRLESLFFSLGQVLSVERFGRGPDQPALDAAVALLSRGRWVHIYPEGFVHQPHSPYDGTLRYFHWGVSRLLLEAGPRPPIVLPVYGRGLQAVFPEDREKRTFGYGAKQPIVYAFGTPIELGTLLEWRERWQALAARAGAGAVTPDMQRLRSAVAAHLRRAVLDTKKRLTPLREHDADPRLGDPLFWKSQSLVKLKGRSMLEKRQKGAADG